MDRQQSGRAAEDLALAYLTLVGMAPLARGFRSGKAEVDLVMQDGETVVFVEVKYRGPGSLARGAESVLWGQRGRIEKAATEWMARNGLCTARFDVVALDHGREGLKLTHYRGAFGSGGGRRF
jgi:putative endonuclease